MQVILLEFVPKYGKIGDVVSVAAGFARNYLFPRKKAIRATEENKKKFEAQRLQLEEKNLTLKTEAQKEAALLEGKVFTIIRQAGETGLLYGSVASRDIAEIVTEEGFKLLKNQVVLVHPIKTLGLHSVPLHLHPEVDLKITMNVARSPEEAERQAKGESLNTREQNSLDDLGLEVGAALQEIHESERN